MTAADPVAFCFPLPRFSSADSSSPVSASAPDSSGGGESDADLTARARALRLLGEPPCSPGGDDGDDEGSGRPASIVAVLGSRGDSDRGEAGKLSDELDSWRVSETFPDPLQRHPPSRRAYPGGTALRACARYPPLESMFPCGGASQPAAGSSGNACSARLRDR